MAEAAGTSLFSVSKIETGERAPSFELACRLADALGCTTDDLRKPAANPAPPKQRGRPRKKAEE